MIIFSVIAAIMLLLAAAGVFLALRYGARSRSVHLMDTAGDELERLEKDREAGLIDADSYEAAKRDLEQHRYSAGEPDDTPSLRRGRGIAFPVVAALVPALGALLLYATLGRPDLVDAGSQADAGSAGRADHEQAGDPREMVQRLAQRMERNPDDLEGWKMLGRSYVMMGQYAKARDAYERALGLTDGSDPQLRISYAEAMVLENPSALDGRAGRIFEEALASHPDNPRALWYGGLASARDGNTEQAAKRWQRLLAQNPPDRLREVVEERLAALGAAPGDEPSARTEASAGRGVSVRVSLGAESGAGLAGNTPVFVFVRPEGAEGGPPLAVKRLRLSDLPATVRMEDADAMVEGNGVSGHEEVRVVARIARSGGVEAQSGDLQGSTTAPVTENGEPVSLAIDRVIP